MLSDGNAASGLWQGSKSSWRVLTSEDACSWSCWELLAFFMSTVNAVISSSGALCLQELASLNQQYERPFGHVFLICGETGS